MRFLIRHDLRDISISGNHFYVTSLFTKFIEELKNKYLQHEFILTKDKEYEKFGQGGIYSCMSLSIINEETNNYVLISLFDNWKYHFMKHLGWQPKQMKQFFYAGGFGYLDYFNFKNSSTTNVDLEFPDNFEDIYKVFFYNPYFDCCYDKIDEIYEKRKPTTNKLFFRGWLWDFRKKIVENINREDILIIDKNENNQNLNYIQYLEEISNYTSALSLPGGTEICNRDIECFAIGVPIFRPNLQVNYSDPLIPNFHYISFYHHCDYTSWGNPNYLSYDDVKSNLIQTWDLVKENKEFLNFISGNARRWYEQNCSIDKTIEYFMKEINLNLL
jgi:hypothetical protein